MTTPRRQCSAGSQECGVASPAANSPADYAWIVNFNNGNANWINRDNHAFVRAVRPSESHHVELRHLHAAWRAARAGKKPSHEQLRFESDWIAGLIELQNELNACAWEPAPSTLFIATKPKAREIHAPAYRDRIVHHWLAPRLERIYEPTFNFDSYSNRFGKGTHAAVARLGDFIRQVYSGQGGGYFLQLDVFNFFNSIHRPTLLSLLQQRLAAHDLGAPAESAVSALLAQSPHDAGVINACSGAERAQVPAHKRLANAAAGCGIAIGNLSSQFFANVYLNELDQFVKHRLGARRYVRYVDDFVLVHESAWQLEAWQREIEAFLADRLQLRLKPGAILRPLAAGVDFLGYVIKPTHNLVRARVVAHARARLADWERRYVHTGRIVACPVHFTHLRAAWSSYLGHFQHASSFRLVEALRRRFPWLDAAVAAGPFEPDQLTPVSLKVSP
jgi:RNA-directed DNA polymerase